MASETIKDLRMDLRDIVKQLKDLSPDEQARVGKLLQEMATKRQQLCDMERGIADIMGGRDS